MTRSVKTAGSRARSGVAARIHRVRTVPALVALSLAVSVIAIVPGLSAPVQARPAGARAVLSGVVDSGGVPLAATPVTLYRTSQGGAPPISLGSSLTGADGSFRISYAQQGGTSFFLYVIAGPPSAVRLAAVVGPPPVPRKVVVNELTTVAAGFALAQFIGPRGIAGPAPGPQNGAQMAADLADATTGAPGRVLVTPPNGKQTSTWRTFYSLANMLVPCVRSASACGPLFGLATPPRGPAPTGTLEAVADIARNPANDVDGLFGLSFSEPRPYQPALAPSARPDGWILALRFQGDGKTLDGPGNTAIDAEGNAWVTSNYVFSKNPAAPVCGSRLLFKFTPNGSYAPGSPYTGGGLNGDGYGITLDTHGNVWTGNFGFSSHFCTDQPPHLSVSEFTPAGVPISPNQTKRSPGGYTQGGVFWPQGVVADHDDNIWIANCGNDTVTQYLNGNPNAYRGLGNLGIEKPFDIALNKKGQAFVTGNGNKAVAMLNPDGTPTGRSPITGGGLNRPMGIAADIQGNMWIANSAAVNVPCPKGGTRSVGTGSVVLIRSDGQIAPHPFTGGGLTMPWGIAVDGNDNVWVANFKGQRVSELCGFETNNCPPGTRTGQAISPPTGFGFDGLVRQTSVQIDPSGNLWITNNWKLKPLPLRNPGGYQMVVYVGVAGPLRAPLIGPPVPLKG